MGLTEQEKSQQRRRKAVAKNDLQRVILRETMKAEVTADFPSPHKIVEIRKEAKALATRLHAEGVVHSDSGVLKQCEEVIALITYPDDGGLVAAYFHHAFETKMASLELRKK